MFRDAKVGDKVWWFPLGWSEIIDTNKDMGILVKSPLGSVCWFLFNGRFASNDIYPTIYWDEIQITPPPKPKRKVKKTVEGFARPFIYNNRLLVFGEDLDEVTRGVTKKVKAKPATMIIEIEE